MYLVARKRKQKLSLKKSKNKRANKEKMNEAIEWKYERRGHARRVARAVKSFLSPQNIEPMRRNKNDVRSKWIA